VSANVDLVTLDDVNDAAERIAHAVMRTPLISCPWADPGRPLTLKPEILQVIGSFKIRGAVNALARVDASVLARGVVAYSSGNHAQAVAWAAKELGVPAQIVMPEETPQVKVDATRRHGAEVVLCDTGRRVQVAEEIVTSTGGTLVPPFDHPDVIAGQGTIGVEIVEDLPDVDVVLVPVSGGGLASGIAVAVKTMRPGTKVYGVEPALAADARDSLQAGHLVDWPIEDRNRTIADALRSQPSELTFAHLSRLLDGIVAVSEDEILDAIRALALNAHLVAEPGGAVAVAAYLHHADELAPGHVVAVVSGGNIDPAIFARAMGSGGR
jgi:threo-3-hydroxy-L-aspartate ammonia-lyase